MYKADRDKTKEEKQKDKWDKKGQPKLVDNVSVNQYLEQGALEFGDAMNKQGGLVLLKYMRKEDIVYLIQLATEELESRGFKVKDKGVEKKRKSKLVDKNGKGIE